MSKGIMFRDGMEIKTSLHFIIIVDFGWLVSLVGKKLTVITATFDILQRHDEALPQQPIFQVDFFLILEYIVHLELRSLLDLFQLAGRESLFLQFILQPNVLLDLSPPNFDLHFQFLPPQFQLSPGLLLHR